MKHSKFFQLRQALLIKAFVCVSTVAFNSKVESKTILSVNPSFPLVFTDVDDGVRVQMGAKVGIGIEVQKLFDTAPIALGVFYQGLLFSSYGPMALNLNGATITYYPFGAPLKRLNIDGAVTLEERRASVFVKSGIGLAFFNFQDFDEVAFGASAFSFIMSAGFDQPFTKDFSAGVEALYLTTFGGISTASTEELDIPVGATGFIFAARMSFFFD
jgi:hypothetical protein